MFGLRWCRWVSVDGFVRCCVELWCLGFCDLMFLGLVSWMCVITVLFSAFVCVVYYSILVCRGA